VQLGNRRFVVVAALSIGIAFALSGCSAVGSLTGWDATAVTMGQQALTSTSSGASSSTTGWSSEATCPYSMEDGMASTLPVGGSVTTLIPASITGVPADPGLTAGDVPSCAFGLRASGSSPTVDEVIFIGMVDSYQLAIVERLEDDGFVAGATSTVTLGTEQTFTKGTSRVAIARFNTDDLSVFAVIG
jgi:hypothetical protein